MDARASRSTAPRWPFFRRLRALLLVVARLSFHLPVATINGIRDRSYRPRAAIQAASATAAGMRVSRSEPSLLTLAGDDAPPEAAPRRAAGSGELAATVSSPLARDSVDAEGRKTVNEYVRERVIGRGSYAKVVLYRHAPTGLMCALKVCCKSRLARVRVAPGGTALMDVQREIRVLQRLQHPHVVQLREVIDDPSSDKLYLVFEYLDGGPVFPEDEPPVGGVGEEMARRVFRDVSAALLYVHSQGVVHNDIKPANILCTAHGTAKLADFGVCQEVASPDDLQRRSPGTPAFTAPECCTGEPFKGVAADTWALGCTLYAMVCGRHPFLGPSLMDTYDKIQSEPLILPPDMSPSLADLLTRLLHK
ncbi:unnamed protein product, partial [Closterium sp. Naga37s-1]